MILTCVGSLQSAVKSFSSSVERLGDAAGVRLLLSSNRNFLKGSAEHRDQITFVKYVKIK